MIKWMLPFLTLLVSCGASAPDKPGFKEMDVIGETISKKYHLKYLYSSIGSLVGSDKSFWVMSLTSDKKMTFEEGKELATRLVVDLLNEAMVKRTIFKQYNENRGKEKFDTELFGFRLAFWDDQVERPLAPYLAQIRYVENRLYFHYANPQTQELTEPIEVTLLPLKP